MPGVRADLERLVRIPGIAFDHSHVERSAVTELLRGCGLDTQIVRAGGQPAVIGRRAAPPGAPTVLLYAHHDVQPVGDPALWTSGPFQPVERNGDQLPVGVVVFVEREEEYGSDSLGDIIAAHHEELRCEVIVIADSGNWEIRQPALTTSLRGMVDLFAEVRVLKSAVHSGMFGGAVPDALMVLARLLSTLHDDEGEVAVDGLIGREGPASTTPRTVPARGRHPRRGPADRRRHDHRPDLDQAGHVRDVTTTSPDSARSPQHVRGMHMSRSTMSLPLHNANPTQTEGESANSAVSSLLTKCRPAHAGLFRGHGPDHPCHAGRRAGAD
jgi:acetylornithine deacetylase/succinyl-diaminopimelate desuccinylase-like protein